MNKKWKLSLEISVQFLILRIISKIVGHVSPQIRRLLRKISDKDFCPDNYIFLSKFVHQIQYATILKKSPFTGEINRRFSICNTSFKRFFFNHTEFSSALGVLRAFGICEYRMKNFSNIMTIFRPFVSTCTRSFTRILAAFE